jgi:CBS domain containing-hemolysin-like protein
MGSSFLELIVIALLVAFNGVFVAAEIALVTVRRSRIRQLSDEGDARARRVARMTEQPARQLATIQLGWRTPSATPSCCRDPSTCWAAVSDPWSGCSRPSPTR